MNAQADFTSGCPPPPPNVEIVAIPAGDQPSGSSELQVSAPVGVAPRDVHITPSDTHTTGPIAIVPPGARAAIEITSSGLKSTGGEVEATRVAGESSKEKKCKRKGKRPSKRKSSSKSSKRSSKRAERCAAKDAAEEEKSTKHFKDLVTWWKQAREDLKTPSSRIAEMEGENLSPDWVLLSQTAHTRVEKHLAYVLMQASAFGHNLALKCSMFQNDKADAEKKIHELQQSLERARATEKKALEAKATADARVAALEARLSATLEENKKQVVDALEQGRTDGFSTGLLAGKIEGLTEGREVFRQFDEYKQSLSSA
ncbi:hypothetical protein Salat_1237400 [Sesamum alatum]|uniref:Uncharacterized protein n=1 Tax=Sesamum alatum TaxID=300844 RepID=A0AAE1YFK3_9LAMI|nr:hypothetical protein Salat_1237400 [Sesamum alatum]